VQHVIFVCTLKKDPPDTTVQEKNLSIQSKIFKYNEIANIKSKSLNGEMALWLRCLPLNPGIMGLNLTVVMTMFPNKTLLGSKKLTMECGSNLQAP
jgi:hypothetical protein